MTFSIIPKDDKRQALRVRRTLMALTGGIIHFIICYFLMSLGLFWISKTQFFLMFIPIGVAELSIFFTIRLGINKHFKDPSLTHLQMYMTVVVVTITIFFLKEQRPILYLIEVLIMIFGSLRMRLNQFLLITITAIGLTAIAIFTSHYLHPEYFNMGIEVAGLVSFGLVMFCFALIGTEVSTLREMLNQRKNDLKKALTRIEEIAIIDELTGIYNRRQIMGILNEQQSLVDRGIYMFSVCFMDLDHFKNVNDTHGHSIGDIVLKKFSDAAKSQTRAGDHVASIGGEEFLVVAAGANKEAAATVAERIRHCAESMDFSNDAKGLKVTVSIGVTMCRMGEKIDEILSRADKALYQAKQGGRNRVVSL